MEMGCIGFLLGAVVAIVMIGIGVLIGDYNGDIERKHGLDNDIRLYVPVRYRDRGRDKRSSKPTSEEIVTVLYLLRIGASNHEKEIIDYLIDREDIDEEVYTDRNHKKAGTVDGARENCETIRFSAKTARTDRD